LRLTSATATKDRKSMHRSIATVSISGTLRQKMEAIAAARFDGIELFENDFISYNGSAADLRAMSADLGLSMDLYQPFRDFEGMPDAQFRRSIERAERKFDLMQALGIPTMLVCSNTSPLALPDAERCAAQLYELAERASKRNIRIGYEALAWGRHVKLYGQAWSIVQRADHPHLGLILDSFHTLSLNDDPTGIANLPGDKIFFLQMADAPRMGMDVLQWARHFRCFPGQGQFDVENFFEQVLLSGYNGPLSLEIFNDVFRAAPTRRTATDAMRSLLFLESEVRDRLLNCSSGYPASLKPVKALERIELFKPPAVPALYRFSFLEFAVDAASAQELGALLENLGFARIGRHRSKDVILYGQGAIRLILNAQTDSFAASRYAMHGPSVCAIGIDTSNSERAVNRATSLCSARFDSAIAPGELRIPAIRVPGGMVMHFTQTHAGAQTFFDTDFIVESGPEPRVAASGLTTIDHVALGLAVDELDTWVLFCRAVIGLQPSDSLELADPFGLIRSCGVSNQDRTVRFVLNASQSAGTRTARTVASMGGASIHHIALGSEDIFASVEAMRSRAVPFVPISANYYDDLLTRYDLEAGLLERIRGLGILFDRTADGDYFHIYTESFANHFFFEIVQRVDAYDSYGALNAPARMASQAQRSDNR
jgi:4-hydroxyphenylpyruvate dioxygenase